MSLLSWIWDIDQDTKIIRLKDEIKSLKERVEILEGWIIYHEHEIQEGKELNELNKKRG